MSRIGLRAGRCWLASMARIVLFLVLAPRCAFAQNAPPLRVILLPSLIPQAIAQMLPITFDSPDTSAIEPQKITVVTMVYCGANADGGANAVGVAVPGQARALPEPGVSKSDCTAALGETAARLMNTGGNFDWLEAIKLRVSWTPWRLTLSIVSAAGAARPGFNAPPLNHLGQVESFNTAGLHILTGPGSNAAFDVAVGFAGSAITMIAFPSGRVGNPGSYLSDPAIQTEIANAPAASNVIADAQYTFINEVLRLYGSTFEIPIPIEGATEKMTAKNVTVNGGDNVMTVAGKLEYQAIGYDASVLCRGQDLAVNQVTLDAPGANCNQDDLMTRLQCQGQSVALYGSSKALAATITNYYQGQPLHVSTRTQPLDFAIGDNNYQATFDALKSSSHGGVFSEAGRASIRRVGGS
jgi:hypothetical protein